MNELHMQGSTTERLLFDYITDKESKQWLEFYSNNINRRFLGVEEYSAEEAWSKRLEREAWRGKYNLGSSALLRLKDSGEAIGSCGILIQNIDGNCILEIGYGLFENARGKGFVTEAAMACLARVTLLGVAPSVHCIIHHENTPSMAVAKRMGMEFKKATKFKGFDIHLFQKSLK